MRGLVGVVKRTLWLRKHLAQRRENQSCRLAADFRINKKQGGRVRIPVGPIGQIITSSYTNCN